MKKKSNYTASFKSKVVMKSIQGKISNAELCSKYKIPTTTL